MIEKYRLIGLQLSVDGEGRLQCRSILNSYLYRDMANDPSLIIAHPSLYLCFGSGNEDYVYLIQTHPHIPYIVLATLPHFPPCWCYISKGYDEWVLVYLETILILPDSSKYPICFCPQCTLYDLYLGWKPFLHFDIRSISYTVEIFGLPFPALLGVRSGFVTYVYHFSLGEVMLRWHIRKGSSFMLPTSRWLLCYELFVVGYKHLALLHPSDNLVCISCVLTVPPSYLSSAVCSALWWCFLTARYPLFCNVWPVYFVQIRSNQIMVSNFADWLIPDILVWKTLNHSQLISILLVWRTLNHFHHILLSTTLQNGPGSTLRLMYWIGIGALSSRDLASFEEYKFKAKLNATSNQIVEVDLRLSILCCNRLVALLWFVSEKLSKLLLYLGSLKPP